MTEIIGIAAGFAFLVGLVAVCATGDERHVADRLERFVRSERRA